MWDRRAIYVSNHDGDTIKMILDQGFNDTKEIDVRLLGVFAPELKQVGGLECQEFVRNWFAWRRSATSKWDFVVTTARMKVADKEQKTLDRYLGTVTSIDGSQNLNVDVMQFIAQNGYDGGTGS